MEDFDSTKDYTKTGEYYDRKNYKAYVANLPQEEIVELLANKIIGSKLKLSNWNKMELADNLAEIKFGKEED